MLKNLVHLLCLLGAGSCLVCDLNEQPPGQYRTFSRVREGRAVFLLLPAPSSHVLSFFSFLLPCAFFLLFPAPSPRTTHLMRLLHTPPSKGMISPKGALHLPICFICKTRSNQCKWPVDVITSDWIVVIKINHPSCSQTLTPWFRKSNKGISQCHGRKRFWWCK